MTVSNDKETLCAMALARISFYKLSGILQLYRMAGSATAVVENYRNLRDILPDASPRLIEVLADLPKMVACAEEEMAWCQTYGVKVMAIGSSEYPHRLAECDDAPLALYYKGNADLNARRVINIIGTRKCTTYGQDLIRRFITDMTMMCPGVLVVSGLAYGVDICAHRHALECGLPTVGVLAHGLDDLYPYAHRNTAAEMTRNGGLLTEFMTHTNADKINFVRRNRIVAGMSDACILVESAARGGGLITADISRGYNREVFAFPGRVGDIYSEGCNNLIRNNTAMLLTNAEDFIKTMGWEGDSTLAKAREEGIEREMFPNLSPEEQTVVRVLTANNDLHLNMLSAQTGIPVSRLTAVLFEMEMKGLLKNMAGGLYHLLK